MSLNRVGVVVHKWNIAAMPSPHGMKRIHRLNPYTVHISMKARYAPGLYCGAVS